MKQINLLALFAAAATWALAQAPAAEESVSIQNGVAAFHVGTNIPAIEVSGKSGALQARVRMQRDDSGLRLEHIEAWVPAESLKTGMAIRDTHMRRMIFTNAQGQAPDLRFESGEARCPGVMPGKEAACSISGTLAIRGMARPFTIPLKVRQDGSAAFRVTGDGVVKLSDYGIEQPTQLGVKTSDEVSIHLDFSGKEAALVAAAPGGR
jgi:polyisoprenoid-binding protein YceI